MTSSLVTGFIAVMFYFSPVTVRPVIYILTSSLFISNYFVLGTFASEILPTPTRKGS